MKKYIAIICALSMSCAIFASCGKEKKDSDKDSKSPKGDVTVTTSDETSAKDESEVPSVKDENTRTKAFYDSLDGKSFKLTMVTTSDMFEDQTTSVEMNGENYHLSMSEGDTKSDLYLVDGVMYSLMFDNKIYNVNENPDAMYLNVDPSMYTMGIEEGYVFDSSVETEDGLICEKYFAPDLFTGAVSTNEDDDEATVYKYYYKEDSTYPEKIEVRTYSMEQTTKITEFSFEEVNIEIPDLEGWTDDTETAGADAGVDEEVIVE